MQPKPCLVLDDEVSVRTAIKAILEGEQSQTIEAEDAIRALQLIGGPAKGSSLHRGESAFSVS
jgi:CheY-like chemotaxis protein